MNYETPIPKDGLWHRAWRKFFKDTFGMMGLTVVVIYFLIACGVWTGLLAADWADLNGDMWEGISKEHWFGTNINGQDILSRTLYSTKVAFEVGLIVAVSSTLIGGVMGALAGFYSGRFIDRIIMWIYGTIDSIPFYLFVAAVVVALPDSAYSMHIAMISTFWTGTCTLIRGEFIKIKNLDYVEAAHAIGVPARQIIFRHIMPNTYHLMLVQITILFVTAIKSEVILSFLGLGIKDGTSWGLMFSAASQEVGGGVMNTFFAASSFMFILVLGFNLFSDALQDALDPKKI